MSKINIQPLGDRVLVEQKQEAEQIKGGIVIPDSAKEKPLEAVVVCQPNSFCSATRHVASFFPVLNS